MKPLLAAAVAILPAFCRVGAASLADEWALLPSPRSITSTEGESSHPSNFTHITARGCSMPALFGMVDRLPQAPTGQGAAIVLQIDTVGTPQSPEGYTLSLNHSGVIIKSRSEKGLMYGAITLDQLLTQASETGRTIPPLEITDHPATEFRAVHIDTKHHLDRTEYYYRLIDRLAQWKINAVIWEIEDKLRYERRPECAAPNALSKQEMAALCRYAHERGIEINPLVQGLGHAGFILKHHPELRENPQSDWEFCPTNPDTYALQFDLYLDAFEAMPYGRFLHVGGDEVSAIGIDERCRATGKSPFELQMVWLKKVTDFAKAHGRTPIFWDDMPFKYAGLWWVLHGNLSNEEVLKNWKTERLEEAVALFPTDCVYMRWLYDDPDYTAHRKILDWYAGHNLKVMGATAAADGGSTFMPRHGSKATHIRNFCRMAQEYNLEGILATAWDDGSPHAETFTRGFAALAQWSWNPEARTEETFKGVHARREFGLQPHQTAFIEQLEEMANFFDGALVTKGRRNPAWQIDPFTTITLPNARQPGVWSARYAAKLDSARIMQAAYPRILAQINEAQTQARRNRYTLDVYEQNLHLFHWPVKLLLALEAYDNAADPLARRSCARAIAQVADDFDTMRSQLEQVYSRTRFITQPTGYIPDMNHHNHLAAMSADYSWLYLYELALLKELRPWLASLNP